MRIVHITAGAGGRICGSCLHDNALVRSLLAHGCDALLVPAYVPTTTDEENVAGERIVMGGVNVWLQEHCSLFRHTPRWFDRLLDSRRLLGWLSSRTGATRPADLGPLTVSTLMGERGRQRKEVEKLAAWLATEIRPDVVHLSNALLLGLARRLREVTGARIVCSLSGEDIFIGQIPEPHRGRIHALLRERAADIDRFVALNGFFADFMSGLLEVPRDTISVIPHGVDATALAPRPPDLAARRRSRGGRRVVGFLARACPEKGLDQLVAALPLLARDRDVEVVAAGATVDAERDYIARCQALARDLGVADRFRWLGQVDRAAKLDLLGSIDVFALPTTHPEAKGLSVIEAMAAGVPVVAADHGTFPELLGVAEAAAPRVLEKSGVPDKSGVVAAPAGLLHEPGDPADLARAVAAILDDEALAAALGGQGHARARSLHTAERMAAAHAALYASLVPG